MTDFDRSFEDLHASYRNLRYDLDANWFDSNTSRARIAFGAGRRSEILRLVEELGGGGVLLIGTPAAETRYADVWNDLESVKAGTFWGATPHCPIDVVEACRREFASSGARIVVAVGGGSTLGLGKILSAEEGAEFIALPTTYCGTEMNPLYGRKSRTEKVVRKDISCLPRAVIYDPQLTIALPKHVSVCTGLNGLAHAVEALYPQNPDPRCCALSEQALLAFRDGLAGSIENPANTKARGLAMLGGHLGGVVIALAGIALHHELCHVLGGIYGRAHGEINSVLLPHVVDYNLPKIPCAGEAVNRVFGSTNAAHGIYQFARSLDAPASLLELGFPRDCVGNSASALMAHDFWNPRSMDRAGIEYLLENAYHGWPPGQERDNAGPADCMRMGEMI